MLIPQYDAINQSAPGLPGCDNRAQVIFEERWPFISAFFKQHLDTDLTDIINLGAEQRTRLRHQFRELEEEVCQNQSPDTVIRAHGRSHWYDTHLLPLAQRLGLVERAKRQTIASLWHRGRFDQPISGRKRRVRPPLAEVSTNLLVVLDQKLTTKQQAIILVTCGMCSDEAVARSVLTALLNIDNNAASRARGVILAVSEYGRIGSLKDSDHPERDTLFALQQQFDHIAYLHTQPGVIMALLRADLIALGQSLSEFKPTQALHRPNLLHEPRVSQFRDRCRHVLTPELHHALVSSLAQRRSCSEDDAAILLNTVVNQGLEGVIEWRSNVAPQIGRRILLQVRIAREVEQHLSALLPEARQKIAALLEHLQDAAHEVGIALNIPRLLRQPPSSYNRVRLGRLFSFGHPSQMRRKQRRRSFTKQQGRRQLRVPTHQSQANPLDEKLVTAFSNRAGLNPSNDHREARTKIRQFLTYGGLGLFSKGEWNQLFDYRFVEWLNFFKLGKPDGTLDWSTMMAALRRYAQQEGLIVPSSQLARSLFNSLPKPPNWHGGYGEAVAPVRQRATLTLQAPYLHACWVILQMRQRLPIELIDETGQALSASACVLIVFEEAIERPVSLWIDADSEPGLALYQALFHPGHVGWPLRGIPDTIKIPHSTLKGQQSEIAQSTSWMSSKLQPLNPVQQSRLREKMTYAEDLMRRLFLDGTRYLRRTFGTLRLTRQQALDALLNWFSDENPGGGACFPHHRVPEVPVQSPASGQGILPGYHLPAAGWLLPTMGEVRTQRDRIVYRGTTYTASGFHTEPGIIVKLRGFPFQYANIPSHIFVETANGELMVLTDKYYVNSLGGTHE